MNRVLVTGVVGTIGAARVQPLISDAGFQVRVPDQRQAPQWVGDWCEVRTGDVRRTDEAREAMHGCSHVIHPAAIVGEIADFHEVSPYELTEGNNTVVRATLGEDVQRVSYVLSSTPIPARSRGLR